MKKISRKGWSKVSFGEVCKNVNLNEKDPISNGIEKYIGLEHIEGECLHIKSWGNVSEGTTFTKKFLKGHVLFGKRRAYLKKAAITEFDGICSGDILVFEANEKRIDKNLFPFLVSSNRFFDFAVQTSAGSLSPRTKFQDLSKFEFLLPPKEEQAKLAELLWAGDKMIEEKITTLDKLNIAKKRYSINNYQDKSMPLSSIKAISTINPRIEKSINDETEVSFIAMADVSEDGQILNKKIRKYKDVKKGFTYFEEGDILFAKITPCMENGKGAHAVNLKNKIAFGSTEFHVIKPNIESDALYIFYISQLDIFRKEAEKLMVGSAGQRRVQADFFDFFKIHLPGKDSRLKFGLLMKKIQEQEIKVKENILNTKLIQKQLLNKIFSNNGL